MKLAIDPLHSGKPGGQVGVGSKLSKREKREVIHEMKKKEVSTFYFAPRCLPKNKRGFLPSASYLWAYFPHPLRTMVRYLGQGVRHVEALNARELLSSLALFQRTVVKNGLAVKFVPPSS